MSEYQFSEEQKVLDEFRDKVGRKHGRKTMVGLYDLDLFCLQDYGYGCSVKWSDLEIYNSENSYRGWNDETDDYQRSIKEQMIFELKDYQKRLENLISILIRGE